MRRRKKAKWPLVLISLLYFTGVAVFLYPFIGNLVLLITTDSKIAEYEETVQEMPDSELELQIKEAEAYNAALYNGQVADTDAKKLRITKDVVSYLDIPSIHVYLPVYYGTTDEILKKGCGCLENTSIPIGGINTHSVIAGHTGFPTAEMLTNLDRMKEGDLFYIHTLDRVLAYKVNQIEMVMPDMAESLYIKTNRDCVTLLTCTPYGINDKRLLVHGERVPYGELSHTSFLPSTAKEYRNREILRQLLPVIIILVVAFIQYFLGYFLVRVKKK